MYVFRHSFSILVFSAICMAIIVASSTLTWERSEQLTNKSKEAQDASASESYFTDVNYYVFDNGKSSLQLDAKELTVNSLTERVGFLSPIGVVFTDRGEPVYYSAKRGVLVQKSNILTLTEEVRLRLDNSTLDSDNLIYDLKNDKINGNGSVRTTSRSIDGQDVIKVESNRVIAWPRQQKSTYLGNVKGKIERPKVYEENVDFRSEKMSLDMVKSLVNLNGNVYFKKQQLRAHSRRGEIFLENYNKRLKYFVLYDDVKVVEKVMLEGLNSSSFDRKAFSEKLEGMMSEGRIILTGYPKVFQQGDVIKGNRITLRENNEIVEVDDANTSFHLKQ